jgi:hypothetical protein
MSKHPQPLRALRSRVTAFGLFLALAGIVAAPFVGCSSKGPPTSFSLALHPDSSCASAPVSCVNQLKVSLQSPAGSAIGDWNLPFTVTGPAAPLGTLPIRGQGRFVVTGVANVATAVTVFTGASQLVSFDPKNDQQVVVDVSCPVIANPCGTPTVTPTPGPQFVSGTSANLVLGEPDYTSCTPPASVANQLIEPDGIYTAPASPELWITDRNNFRIGMWSDRTALTNGLAIDHVVGRGGITLGGNPGGNNAANRFAHPMDVVGIPGGLLVADNENHRAPFFSPTPSAPDTNSSQVLGQNNVNNNNANAGGLSATSLLNPSGVAYSTTSGLWVADTGNNRVLGYGLEPALQTQDPAVKVLGQGIVFTTGTINKGGLSGASLSAPHHVATDGKRLYVADTGNNRVLVWLDIQSAASGAPADFALGQPDLTTATVAAPPTDASMNAPRGVTASQERLVVADSGNHRVLIFQPPPTAANIHATQILGQPTFTTADMNHQTAGTGNCPATNTCVQTAPKPQAYSMARPGAVWLDGEDLWVSDTCNHRTIRFTAH